MNIQKIKEWLKSKPTWLKILVTIVCVLLLGASAWFGLQSCASVDIDKFNVNTDKVQVDVEGVKVHPKQADGVSYINSCLDSIYDEYGIDSLWDLPYSDLDDICHTYFDKTYSDFINGYSGYVYNGIYFVYEGEEVL